MQGNPGQDEFEEVWIATTEVNEKGELEEPIANKNRENV